VLIRGLAKRSSQRAAKLDSRSYVACGRMCTEIGSARPRWTTCWRCCRVLQIPAMLGATKSLARTMKDREMKGNDILDVCRRLKQITDELAAMVDEEIGRGENGETDDNVEEGGTFWMMSASKQVKLVGTAQSLIAGITDALRTATVDHSKVFEVMALLSAITDTFGGKRH
jgi:hypothetical protein